MVDYSPARLHFQHGSTGSMVCVRVERLFDRAAPPEKHRDTNFLVLVLAEFNLETDYLKTFAEGLKDLIADEIEVFGGNPAGFAGERMNNGLSQGRRLF